VVFLGRRQEDLDPLIMAIRQLEFAGPVDGVRHVH
jgi:hypothetical protein